MGQAKGLPSSKSCARPLGGSSGREHGSDHESHHLGYESPVDIQKLKPLNGLGDLESPSKGSAPRRREAWMGGGAESHFSALEPWAND